MENNQVNVQNEFVDTTVEMVTTELPTFVSMPGYNRNNRKDIGFSQNQKHMGVANYTSKQESKKVLRDVTMAYNACIA